MSRRPATWITSVALHGLAVLVLRVIPTPGAVTRATRDERPIDLDVIAAPEPERAPEPEPPPAPTNTPPPPAAAARVVATTHPAMRTVTAEPAPSAAPSSAPSSAPPVTTNTPPTNTPPPLRAADILRASDDVAVRGAAERWLPPAAATSRPERNIYGPAAGSGEANSAERLREVAAGPTREMLAGTVRDHRPTGSTEHDHAVSRRAMEEFNPVREIPNLGPAVHRAPMDHIAAQSRTVTTGEAMAAEEFDQRHGSSFAGMTYGTRLPEISYHVLKTELDVEQDATGAIRAVRVSRASGMRTFDDAAQRALRAAMPQDSWTAGRARWTRWRFEVSEAAPGWNPFNGNEGWTVISEESGGVSLRMRVRVVAQHLLDDARDAGA